MQVGVPDQIFSGRFPQGNASELFDAAEVFVIRAEFQAWDVIPILDAMPNPRGDFAKLQFGTVKCRVDVRAEVRPENRKRLSEECAPANRLDEHVHLELGIEPAGLQVWPRAPRERGRGTKLRVMLCKTDRRAIEHLVIEPCLDAMHGLLEIRLSF